MIVPVELQTILLLLQCLLAIVFSYLPPASLQLVKNEIFPRKALPCSSRHIQYTTILYPFSNIFYNL